MSWSIYAMQPKNLPATRKYLARVGRALFLASMFEEKCMWLLSLSHILERGTIPRGDAALALEKALKKARLSDAIAKFVSVSGIDKKHVDTLRKARLARNWIAHSAGLLGSLSEMRDVTLVEQTAELRTQLDLLIAGDIVVSKWTDDAESGGEPGDGWLPLMYPKLATSWVMRGALPPLAKLHVDTLNKIRARS